MKIRVVIVEDEKPALAHLMRLLDQSAYVVEVLHRCDSVKGATEWLRAHPLPDLLFLDIQLADGLSFEIFREPGIDCPVIFTTAYEEYAIRAFKLNSVDYLLKPVGAEDLDFALGKFHAQRQKPGEGALQEKQIEALMGLISQSFQSRFVVYAGPRIISFEVDRISCFYSLGHATYLMADKGKSFDIDYSLDHLETRLNPQRFFRISRKYIVNIDAIRDIHSLSASRLKIILRDCSADDVLVSRRKISAFKAWLEH